MQLTCQPELQTQSAIFTETTHAFAEAKCHAGRMASRPHFVHIDRPRASLYHRLRLHFSPVGLIMLRSTDERAVSCSDCGQAVCDCARRRPTSRPPAFQRAPQQRKPASDTIPDLEPGEEEDEADVDDDDLESQTDIRARAVR